MARQRFEPGDTAWEFLVSPNSTTETKSLFLSRGKCIEETQKNNPPESINFFTPLKICGEK